MGASLAAPTSFEVPEFYEYPKFCPALHACKATAELGIDLHYKSLVRLSQDLHITCTLTVNLYLAYLLCALVLPLLWRDWHGTPNFKFEFQCYLLDLVGIS
jgi:hypothetical protein